MPLFLPNLGFPEIILIMVIALLVFGPKKLPDIGRSLGKGFREFRRGTSGIMDEINQEVQGRPQSPVPDQVKPLAQPKVARPEPAQEAADTKETVIDLEGEGSEK